ncbi:hypothetical protein PFW08_004645, partial [Escherichia coli]|nr:hypothetical protein [Escherichia coli]
FAVTNNNDVTTEKKAAQLLYLVINKGISVCVESNPKKLDIRLVTTATILAPALRILNADINSDLSLIEIE